MNWKDADSHFTGEEDSTETLINSARTFLDKSREESTKPFFDSSLLRGLSLSLHLTLVALHVLLIAIWAMRLEHQLVFPIDTEKNRIISLVISTISTSFVTIYAALLVFVTQTLWMRRSMQLDQTLTATHDHAAAWAGIGAAISCIQHQKALPASIGGIVSIFLYLGNILVLHITIPAVLSLATFKFPISSPVGTNSLPDFNRSLVELSITNGVALLDNSGWQTATSQLYFLPTVVGNGTNLGLYGSTLFDVLDINRGTGNTTVSATGFSFSCGYPTNINSEFILDSEGSGWWDGNWSTQNATGIITIPETQPGMIASFHKYDAQSVMLYSTIPIIDSNGTRGPLVSLHPPMNTSISTVQLLQCSYTIVNQTAVVDAQSNRIQTVEPDLGKSPATWHPYTRPTNILTLDNVNIFDVFPFLYYSAPVSDIPRDPVDFYTDGNEAPLTVADLYLAQKLNLFPLPADTVDSFISVVPAANLTLQDVEKGLSELMAAIFWTIGHLPPIHQNSVYCGDIICFNDTETPFILLRGTASVTETITEARLDLSIIAVAAGLAVSIALLLLSLPTSLFHKGGDNPTDIPIDGTGLLHAIWMYRNHPELEKLLPQVENPTISNLREAGMVRTRLVSRVDLRKRRSCESF